MGCEVTVFNRGKTQADLPPEVNHIRGERSTTTDKVSLSVWLPSSTGYDSLHQQDALATMSTFKGIAQRVVAMHGCVSCLRSNPGLNLVPLSQCRLQKIPAQGLYILSGICLKGLNAPADYEKIVVERVIMGNPDLPGTILRLPMVYGPETPYRLFPYLQRMDDNRPVIVLEESCSMARFLWICENAAAAIALAVTNERAMNRIYVADSEVLSEAERLSRVGQVAGWQVKSLLSTQEYLPEEWNLPYNIKQHWFVDTTRIRQELGYSEVVHK